MVPNTGKIINEKWERKLNGGYLVGARWWIWNGVRNAERSMQMKEKKRVRSDHGSWGQWHVSVGDAVVAKE